MNLSYLDFDPRNYYLYITFQHWIRVEMRCGVRIRRLGLGVPNSIHGPATLTVRGGTSFEEAALSSIAAVPCAPAPSSKERPLSHLTQIQLLADCKQVSLY